MVASVPPGRQGRTCSVANTVCCRAPLLDWKESGNFPAGPATGTENTSCWFCPGSKVTGDEREDVTPAGRPLMETVTLLLNPLSPMAVTTTGTLVSPTPTESAAGDTCRLKSGSPPAMLLPPPQPRRLSAAMKVRAKKGDKRA